ncbi:tetratricopeptide repeat protein [Colwellia psychrerythraea]|uniref:Tetratricopeptide repeat-containing protein n=1 Tax=Colwellia psychrerythraea TaxID=28229 RepID=A0A099KW91_COLPS|nr:tetratricopeptide repeat protein [Colwellia psychrerythraea]KGJ95009.1 Tetratricopeptide repeat-containing protein [Colwellia psychrerythraea]
MLLVFQKAGHFLLVSHSWLKLALIAVFSFVLLGCQSTPENGNSTRKTLADLANDQASIEIDAITLSRSQRASKLAQLYQTILTLEPDEEVRAQIEYRIVQMNTQAYELIDDQAFTDEQGLQKSDAALNALIVSYQDLITRFPERSDNEWMQYQLAKALDLQGKSKASLVQMEALLAKYPHSQYSDELHFRRGDIYYNFQAYPAALQAYSSVSKAVNTAANNGTYYINSRYMSAWVLFKLNRLSDADIEFISLLDYIVEQEKLHAYQDDFSFDKLNPRYTSLVADIQRVLSISLSQQQQSESLVALIKQQQGLTNLQLYRHILFKNLADFLISNELKYDAELVYKAYITLEPDSIWAARYSLELLALLEQQGKYSASRTLKQNYVKQFGLQSTFWQKAHAAKVNESLTQREINDEILPHLLDFSYQHSRRLYAQAQRLTTKNKRRIAFINTSLALETYLSLAKLPQANYQKNKPKLSKSLLADELLFADANFEAQQYPQALSTYQLIAYQKEFKVTLGKIIGSKPLTFNQMPVSQIEGTNKAANKLRLEAAYAATLTTRQMLKEAKVKTTDSLTTTGLSDKQKALLLTRNQLDQQFVASYPKDSRVLSLATQATQYAYSAKDHLAVKYYSDFILQSHLVIPFPSPESTTTPEPKVYLPIKLAKLTKIAQQQVQIASQLQANSFYQQKYYIQAESAYQLAISYVKSTNNVQRKKYKEMRELLASCIYFQAQALAKEQPLLAVQDYLRVGKVVPESSYRLNAEFDAGNILLAQKKWRQGIEVLSDFKKRYPSHEYSRSISAKLANAYENTGQWQLAAAQLLMMINGVEAAGFSSELKREAQYSAAQYYQKAGNTDKALTTYRTYAHKYPEPFVVAQEVRLKLSEFYQQKKDTNKQYFWYRKIVKYHDIKLRNSKTEITARAEYLASFAALGLGKAHQQTFTWTKLKLPLNKSLKRKQSAMKSAIDYYQKVLSYQLAEFVPQASFNLATMYGLLASDIMSSERPDDLDELALEEYEFLLEDIAIPFEDKAIEIHTNNAQRAWQNVFDAWVERSFSALAELDPAQYNKQERKSHVIQAIY